jgi:hypothetical protein
MMADSGNIAAHRWNNDSGRMANIRGQEPLLSRMPCGGKPSSEWHPMA